jgi:glyoxylase-like metal-dependent hydrolase (beta-lactamase superfamily II)
MARPGVGVGYGGVDMIEIRKLTLGPIQTNCYILACESTMAAAVIDPAWDGRSILAAADDGGWQITHILLTHAHFDHVAGLDDLKNLCGAPIYAHQDAANALGEAAMSAAFFGLRIPSPPPADELLTDGQVIEVGDLKVQVIYTPGHAPGHVSFHIAQYRVLFDGDVLFEDGIGRTDLPGSDHATLMRTIRERLLTLPDETRVFPGHGEPTTIGDERHKNPFLQELDDDPGRRWLDTLGIGEDDDQD